MYNLPYFKEKDPQAVIAFIHQHPFAFMVGCDDQNRPVATQIPVFLEQREEGIFLTGHMMRQTDHHLAFEKNDAVLCVFTGPHAYVSATWYSQPQQASTWNYLSVHVKGKLRFLDEDGLVEVLRKTSLHFEKNDPHAPTVYDNLPGPYRTKLMKAIIGFEVLVEAIDHVFKLSQNKDQESYRQIVNELDRDHGGGKTVADEMKKRESSLFGE
ncbi:MAG: FMN-binding negative transcriptional regulator [Flavisolibacter sp.]